MRIIRLTLRVYLKLALQKMTAYLKSYPKRFLVAGLLATLAWTVANAAEFEAVLTIKNNRFEPVEIRVPADQRIRLTVLNQDGTPEEFESHKLNREKVVAPGAKVVIFMGPLKAGRYEFWGDYHADTAKGVVVAE